MPITGSQLLVSECSTSLDGKTFACIIMLSVHICAFCSDGIRQ